MTRSSFDLLVSRPKQFPFLNETFATWMLVLLLSWKEEVTLSSHLYSVRRRLQMRAKPDNKRRDYEFRTAEQGHKHDG